MENKDLKDLSDEELLEYEKIASNNVSKFDNFQNAQKLLLNSAYGSVGNKYFRYYSNDIASGITSAGQLSIRWAEKEINNWLNSVLKTEQFHDFVAYIDTDSLYIDLSMVYHLAYGDDGVPDDIHKVIDFLDKFSEEKITKAIDKGYQRLANYVNSYEQAMEMERENISSRAVWTGKKHYIMDVYDSEGLRYDEPKQKIMGMEAIKSTFPEIAKKTLKECYRIILQEDEESLIHKVEEFKNEWYESSIEDIALNSSVNGLSKYADKDHVYIKGTPKHVRGSLVYNKWIKDKGLDKDKELILEGEKIKYVSLKDPNPLHEDVIAFPGFFVRDGEIEHFVDYDMQFQKAFLGPLENIVDVIGWSTEHKASLGIFFS